MQDAFMISQASGKPELYSVEAADSVKLSKQYLLKFKKMLQYTAHTTVYHGTLLTVLHTHCKKRQ